MVVFIVVLTGAPANANEIRPALLDIKEQNTGLYAVTWKVPVRGNRALARVAIQHWQRRGLLDDRAGDVIYSLRCLTEPAILIPAKD